MPTAHAKKDSMKRLLKSVLSEMIEENEGLLSRIFEEAIEDAFMSHAIKKCKPSRKVSRERVFETLARISK